MADAIGNKAAKDYHLDIPATNQGFFAKGLGNTETLYGCGHRIFYLFLVKCPRFMQYFGKEQMTPMLLRDPGNIQNTQEETL